MQAILLVAEDKAVPASVPFKGTLEEVYKYLNCTMVQRIATPIPGLIMLVDEDARMKKSPRNHKAMLFFPGAIFGHAILTYEKLVNEGTEDEDMAWVGIPPKFDFKTVAESSYQRICASIGEHPLLTLEGERK